MTSEQFKENPNTEKKTKFYAKDILTTLLILSLLGTWAFIIWDRNNSREKAQKQAVAIQNLSDERDKLHNEYEDVMQLYTNMKISNDIKDSLIDVKDTEIENKKKQINALIFKSNLTEAELRDAKLLIKSLKVDIEDYKTKISVLEEEKAMLTVENSKITQQRDKLKKDLDSTSTVIQNKNELLNIGSTLVATKFSVKSINERGGKEKITTRAQKVDKLRISFDIEPNKITPSGKKLLYVVVTSPDGNVILIDESNSGVTNTYDGTPMNYTQQVEIDYKTNVGQTISFDWKNPNTFTKGDYKIDVYNNGFKIGTGYLALKKGGLF